MPLKNAAMSVQMILKFFMNDAILFVLFVLVFVTECVMCKVFTEYIHIYVYIFWLLLNTAYYISLLQMFFFF